ncbi:MAG: winged helix-turn-helix domain-containing protein [Candidatus Bathyarchaeia archaeon]|nr:helix-turn-helix domain-containing protein [Candidatus Bathyarchaeota archaeon]
MVEKTVEILRAIGNLNKARIIAHLAKHRGETAESIGKHLGYPLPTVYKYLRELEAVNAVESEARGNTRVYFAGEFKLEVSPQKLMEAFEEQTMMELYKARFGAEGVEKLRKVAAKAKAGKMTFRQAAASLGITYFEFVSLLDEVGALDA